MVSFVFATYLLVIIRPNRWIPYTVRTFEFTRLISVILCFFLFLIVNVIPHESIIFVYLTFFSSILAIAGFDLAINNIHVRYTQRKINVESRERLCRNREHRGKKLVAGRCFNRTCPSNTGGKTQSKLQNL